MNVQVYTQSTKLSSISPLRSTGLRPVMSSRSIIPKEKTSDLSVNFPLAAYSGAKYPKVPMTRVDTCVLLS